MALRRGSDAELQYRAKVVNRRAHVAVRQHSKEVAAARKATERVSLAAAVASEQDPGASSARSAPSSPGGRDAQRDARRDRTRHSAVTDALHVTPNRSVSIPNPALHADADSGSMTVAAIAKASQ